MMTTVGVVVAVTTGRRSANSNEKAALRSLIQRTSPGLCDMQRRMTDGDRSGALNVFYDEVHQGSHVLSAELVKVKSGEAQTFVRAKSLVEADLRTLAPTLKRSVDAFAESLRVAMDIYEPGLWKPC